MSIRFDSQNCISALKIELILAMKQLQTELLNEARQGMRTNEGKESLHDEEITDIANIISASIGGGAWAAMDEFGTGSLMDESNPALEDYKNSSAWNPARSDNKIRSRPNQSGQIDIFGESVNGRGKGGFDLEKKGGEYSPTPPSHAIENALHWMKNGRMQEVIKDTLKGFPFNKYLIVNIGKK